MFGIALFVMILMLSFMLLITGLVIFTVVFWLWMLVDCLQRKKFEDKLVWVLVILFLNVLGSILYYFIAKEKTQAKKSRKR